MNILVQRLTFTDNSTIGELSLDGGDTLCYTLEPPKQPDARGIKCIPQGIYKVIVTHSPRLGYETPRLLGVPGWPNDDVLIHILNTPDQSEGCIGVGMSASVDFIGSSREAFLLLLPKLQPPASAGDLTISVVG